LILEVILIKLKLLIVELVTISIKTILVSYLLVNLLNRYSLCLSS